jgi:hypothetical protein
MARKLREKFHHLNVTDANVIEFISRTSVTHIVNYWKMNLDIEDEHARKIVRLPHMTRTSIRLVELGRSGENLQDMERENRKDQVIRTLLPFPLQHLVKGVEKRTDFISRLTDLRELQPFPQIRKRLKTVLCELEQNNRRAAIKLCKEVEALSRHSSVSATCERAGIAVGVRMEPDAVTPYINIPVQYDLLQRWFRPDRYFLTQLTSVDEKTSARFLKRLFPEVS